MELAKRQNTLPKPLQEILQKGMVLRLIEKDFKTNSDLAPKTIAEAVNEGLPITVVSKVSGVDSVYAQIEFDLIKCLALLNLNLTIKEHQYPFIVRELVDTFPNESIQDFQLCFKNGVKGFYGKIYNVDLSVLAAWMGEYLEEKYSYIERQGEIQRSQERWEQDNAIEEIITKTTEVIKNTPDATTINKTEILRDNILGGLSEAEIQVEGKEKPLRKYIPPDENYVKMHKLKLQWMRECFNPLTGKPNDKWVEFEKF